jgi:glycosyltransferase involved in cell wall biosynthesis
VALPIVATDVGGNGEIVRDGETGKLVSASDAAALAAGMLALLAQPARAATVAQAARVWVEAHGSLENMATRYADLYQASVG